MNLCGNWVLDESDQRGLAELGDVLLEFEENGNLTYVIRSDDKTQKILMTYEVHGSNLITDQPSAPNRESTAFSFLNDNLMVLEFGDEAYSFRRQT
jgi:hypothetical protein